MRALPAALLSASLLAPATGVAQNLVGENVPPPLKLNRQMVMGDPNRDPNWDWTANVEYDLVTASQTYYGVSLPYYSNAGPASVLNVAGDRDILPQDGWRLLLRDFGPGAPQAFFILYNRNRGLLRLFYYHPNNQYSHAVGKLSFQTATPEKSAGLFTLSESTDRYLANYGPERTVVSVGVMGVGWCHLDFDVSGYDPTLHLKDDPTFVLQVTGVTEGNLVLSGTINLTQQMAVAHRDSSGGFDASDVINVYKKVAQRYKDVSDARKQYEDMARANTGKKWSDFILHAIGGLAKKKWLAALGPVAGILELVLGGGSSSESQPAPLILDGTLELNGKLTTLAPLYFVLMRVPGSHHIDVAQDELSNVLPLYDVPVGVFNVAQEPRYALYHRLTLLDRWQNRWYGTLDVNNTEPLIVEANLHVFRVTKANAGYAVPDWLVPYRPVGGFNSGTVTDVYSASGWTDILYSKWFPSMYSVRLAVDMSLTPLDALPGTEPVPVVKTYNPAKTVVNGVAPSFPGRPPARPSSLIAVPASSGIDLRWIDNAANESGFVVEWSLSGTGAWSEIASLGPNVTSLSVANVTSGTRYDFRLRATGFAGSSPYTNLARATAP